MSQIVINGTHEEFKELLRLAGRGFRNNAVDGVQGVDAFEACGDMGKCPAEKRCLTLHGDGDVPQAVCLRLLTEYYLGGE